MKVLFVASYNKGYYAPFIVEQAEALRRKGATVELFGVVGKGIKGYVKTLPRLKMAIKSFNPDIIHAHYGLCGLLANLQCKIPVVTTYHGSDINERKILHLSRISMALSGWNIFVSQPTLDIARPHNHYSLIPCGIDLSELQLTKKADARNQMGLDAKKRYVLFAGSFDNTVKNASLAIDAISHIPEAELLELKGYTREQVTLLMCAADVFLMTSHTEGSPQVIKEAMACGCPIVSVNVGDVKWVTEGINGCYIVERDAISIAKQIEDMGSHTRTEGRRRILELGLVNDVVAEKLLHIYKALGNG